MSQTKQAWTPGPWRIWKEAVADRRGDFCTGITAMDGDMVVDTLSAWNREANAKLIAAAPELAKELEMAHRHIQHLLEMLAGTRRKEQREIEPVAERQAQREAALQKAGAM